LESDEQTWPQALRAMWLARFQLLLVNRVVVASALHSAGAAHDFPQLARLNVTFSRSGPRRTGDQARPTSISTYVSGRGTDNN
jgi:hypothetical protein